ncbi:MAG: FliI/YscN family ATPase [Planctomycetota bacterium]
MSHIHQAIEMLESIEPMRIQGSAVALRGLTVLVEDLAVPVGALVEIGSHGTLGEVVGFTRDQAIVMPLGQTAGIRPGDPVVGLQPTPTVGVGNSMLGRCVDGLGRPIDGKGVLSDLQQRPVNPAPIPPLSRSRIKRRLTTGLRSVDLMTPLGRGQRMGVFAGPGVGKSTVLGTMVKQSDADVCVVGLIGERGREVKDFIEHSLGADGLKRSVVVAATGDESPLMRIRAAKVACTVAEFFRDQGKDVLLVMDSATRFAHAQRQVGLSVGEPPATKGYTPSVFAQLALLLERAGSLENGQAGGGSGGGSGGGGSITGIYTVLVEGDDMTEPIADAARGILDGHLILSRKLAQRAHYPAVDVLDSISRVADDIADADHTRARQRATRLLALYAEIEDLVQIGAYSRGSSIEHDVAIEMQPALAAMLKQGRSEVSNFDKARADLIALTSAAYDQIDKGRKKR